MQILGNILLGLASFIYLLPLQLLLGEARRATRQDGGALWGGIFVLVPLWLLLTIALSVVTARGGLDWLPVRRGGQHLLVVLAGLAMLTTSLFGFLGRVEHASQLPGVSRPFLGWADLVLPLVALVFLLLTLNEHLGAAVPAGVYRIPFAVGAAAALLHGGALLGEWFVRAQQSALARVEEEAAFYEKNRRTMVERLKSLDPEKDLAELLDASAHTDPETREVVHAKLAAHPDLRAGLATVLRTWRADAAITYLTSHDISAADRVALAEPALDGMKELTRVADDEIYRSTHFFPDQFDRRARLMLAVADRFAGQGPDYVAVVREFRRVLDTEGAAKVQLNARAILDAWLAQQHPVAPSGR